jgi:transcriptional regulator with XRE-family HTH domain
MEAGVLETLGRGLRRLRELEDLSLEEMSERSGISKRHLIEIERKGVNLHLLTLIRLAEGLERDLPTMWEGIFHEQGQRMEEFLAILRKRALDGLVEVNISRYAQEMGLSPSTLKRYLRRLEEQGRLRLYRHRTGRGNGVIYEVPKVKRKRNGKGSGDH